MIITDDITIHNLSKKQIVRVFFYNTESIL